MKQFDIFIPYKKVYNIIAENFPKISTLIFNIFNNIKITADIKGTFKILFTILNRYTMNINEAFIKFKSYCVVNIKNFLNISFISKTIEKWLINLNGNYSFVFHEIGNLFSYSNIYIKNTIFPTAFSGKYRYFYDMDDKNFEYFDNLTLGETDFILSERSDSSE